MSMAHRALAGSIYFRYRFYQGTAARSQQARFRDGGAGTGNRRPGRQAPPLRLSSSSSRCRRSRPGMPSSSKPCSEIRYRAGRASSAGRSLETVDAPSNVAYSPMGKEAQARIGDVLKQANPTALGKLIPGSPVNLRSGMGLWENCSSLQN